MCAESLPNEDPALIQKLYSLSQGVCSVEYSKLNVALEQDFSYFSAAADEQVIPARGEPISEEGLDAQEKRFLLNLIRILEGCHYHLLSNDEFESALSDDFLLTLPVTVKWQSMDCKMLPNSIWSEFPEAKSMFPEQLADRILIFHNGVATAKLEGRYISQKIELLIAFLIIQPCIRGILWVLSALKIKNSIAQEVPSSYIVSSSDLQCHEDERVVKVENQDHDASICIERYTFDRVFSNPKSILKNFFKTVQLQEACWKDVVVVYRKTVSTEAAGEFDIKSTISPEIKKRNIILKRFRSIPIADMELVFPEMNIKLPPSVLVNIAVALIGVLIALITALKGGLSWAAGWTTITMLGTRLGQVYNTAVTQKVAIEKSVQRLLQERTVASQGAALSSIIRDIQNQQIRQVLIAYFVLLAKPTTPEDLDYHCEKILQQKFNLSVDFTCEEALPLLIKWGMVTTIDESSGLLQAVSLSQCIGILEGIWLESIHDTTKGIGNKMSYIVPLLSKIATPASKATAPIQALGLKASKSIREGAGRQRRRFFTKLRQKTN